MMLIRAVDSVENIFERYFTQLFAYLELKHLWVTN